MRELNCLRCGAAMSFLKSESIQLGEHGFFMGDLAHLLAGGLAVDIYICPECGKVEFFQREPTAYLDEGKPRSEVLNQVACPHCGAKHDPKLSRCPACGRKPEKGLRW